MKIGLISDIHADPGPLDEALRIFEAQGVENILCAGDIAGYGPRLPDCIELLKEHRCQAVLGNHDLWHCADWQGPPRDVEAYLRNLPRRIALQYGDVALHLLHASPVDPLHEGIRLRDAEGALLAEACRFWSKALSDYPSDVLVVGHTHQVFAVELESLLVINPGSCSFNHSCMILELPRKQVELFPLGGQQVLLSWNFGMERQGWAPAGREW